MVNFMLYVCFVYKKDADLLGMMAERLQCVDPAAKIYAVQDVRAPLPKKPHGVQVITSNYNRGGNLNGLANLGGQLAIFQKLLKLEKADFLVKIDADSWVNDLTPFLETTPRDGKPVPDYLATENWEAFRPSGHIYRVSKWLVARLVAMFNARSAANEWPPHYSYPEDLSIFRMAALTGLPCELIPFQSGYSAGLFDGGIGTNAAAVRAGVVHCGEPCADGTRATREHVTLRMRILKYEIEHLCQD